MRPFNNLENKTPSDTYRRVQLACIKVKAHITEPPLEYNQDQTPLLNQGSLWPSRFIITIFWVTEIVWSFRLILEGKTSKEVPESSKLEFSKKCLANYFVLSDAEDKTSRPLNREGIANLPLLRTLLVIRQKSQEQSFWETMDSFVLHSYASLAASRTLLQQLQACLSFTLDSDLFCWYKWKKWFLWTMAAA